MTVEESIKLLALIKLAYPNSYKDIDKDTQLATVKMWQRTFNDLPFAIMEMAIDHFVKKSKFPPTIADVIDELKGLHYEAVQNVLITENDERRKMCIRIMQYTERYKENNSNRIPFNTSKQLNNGTQSLLED